MSDHHGSSEARCQARAAPPPTGNTEQHAPDRLLEIAHIALDVEINLDEKSIKGAVRHDVRVVPPELATFMLDAVALTIDGVSTDGKPVPFVHDGQKIIVRPASPWKRGESHALVIDYRGHPVRGIHFVAPDDAYPDKPRQAWTQGQDEDSRFWFPCVDYPNQKATTEIRVRVPRGFEAISNGRLVSREDKGERTEFHWVQEIPHVTYLVSLVVGQFDVALDRAGRTALRYCVPKGLGRHAQRTFGHTPRMIEVFERLFGHPYPYPKYDQVVVADFLCGGMENTSATTLYEYVMLDETVADAFDRDDLISHELAHQWFGDLLTCRDWAHAWLNEGFATYAEVLWYEHGESRERAAYHLLQASRNYAEESRNEYRRPIVTHTYEAPVDIFDRHLYEKAGCVIHHLRLELGDELFLRGLRRYVETHAGGLVDTHDLRRAFETESGRNLEPFFDQWILRAGHPEIEVTHDYEAAGRRLTINVRQTQEGAQDRPFRFRLPCRVWLAGRKPAFVERTFDVTESQHGFVWNLPDDPCGIRAGQGGLPLVRIAFRRSDSGLAHQLQEDEDLLGRIEAAEQLGKSGTDAAIDALAGRLTREPTWMGQVEIAKALAEARGPKAREALVGALDLRQPRARAAAAEALGAFREDAIAAAALEGLLEREKAPLVRAAAYRALGSTRSASAPATLTKGLWEASWNEVIGRSCLEGLGLLRDKKLVPLFVNSLRRGEYDLRRTAAIDALRETSLALENRTPIREQLELLIEDPSYRVAHAALRGLKTLDDDEAVPALERLASRRFADSRLRRAARAAIKAIQSAPSGKRSPAGSERIERLETELRKLKDRVLGIEDQARVVKPPPGRRTAKKAAKRRRKPRR